MVETILFNLASKILGMIGSGSIGEVGKAWGVEQELNALKDTLSTINAVLLDAERLYGHGGFPNYSIAMGVWFDRLQAAIYDADNLVDEFHYEVLRRRVTRTFLRLDMIADNRTKFHPIATTSQHNAASSSISSEVNESEFVGRFDDRVKLLHLIMAPRVNNDENMFVLPIVGIAGIGKTALVRLLYNHEMVAKHFQLRIWVKVEQYLNVKDVMQKIFQRITDSPHCAGLHSYQCGCIMGNSLSDKDCLEVLWKWAGCREKLGEKHVNAKLSKIAKEIVKKCHGYPRAAKTLGNNLFMETDESKCYTGTDYLNQLWEEVTKALFERKNLRTVFFPFQGLGASDTGFVNRCISKFKGIKPSDAGSKIKKAYQKAALRHNPDKAGQFLARSESGDDGQLWKEIADEVHKDADRLFKMI
ncbi:unnamed protein product [Camellia sinensis]